jgi:hypothetical protein
MACPHQQEPGCCQSCYDAEAARIAALLAKKES